MTSKEKRKEFNDRNNFLVDAYQSAETQKEKNRIADEILKLNEPTVIAYANKHLRFVPHYWRDDLIQEGRIGILKAIEKYSSDKGAKFYTYACIWCDGYMKKLKSREIPHVKVLTEAKVRGILSDFTETRKKIEQENPAISDSLLISKMAEALNVKEDQIVRIMVSNSLTVSVYNGDDSDERYVGFLNHAKKDQFTGDTYISKNERNSHEDEVISMIDGKHIGMEVLDRIRKKKPKKGAIIDRILNEESMTDIAKDYGLSRQRIKQIEVETRNKISERLGATA